MTFWNVRTRKRKHIRESQICFFAEHCGAIRLLTMSKSSREFSISVPMEVLEAYASCQNMKNFASFAREAIIRRLNAEFGFSLDEKAGNFRQGQRVDLFGGKRAEKLPMLQRQAEHARAARREKS